ncbi:hypothetical protein ABKV19_004318 [Rosa sericea]
MLRSTRESTSCSLIRNSDTVRTPGSATRRSSSIANNQRVRNDTQRTIPTALDMDEFFAQVALSTLWMPSRLLS